MDQYTQYNITDVSYEEFVAFLFDHEVIPIPQDSKNGQDPWYWNTVVEFNAVIIAGYYVQLFTDPLFLISRFSEEQLEQGFWAIQSCNLDCSVSEIIWDKDVPAEIRKNCVISMFNLFEKLFSFKPLYTSSNMWWDSLAYGWHCGNRSRSKGGEDEWMQDAMFETLEKILALSSVKCQFAALHGLGHLHHPKTQQLIERYFEKNEMIDADLRNYALCASRFSVM